MTTSPVRVERRAGQRFTYLLPVSIRQCGTAIEGVGFTQDLSSRGVFLFTDAPLTEGAEVELTLRMPSEITLGESMPVRCRGHILRISRPMVREQGSPATVRAETKIGVAVRLECYEYLQESTEPARAATPHSQHEHEDERPFAHSVARPSLL
jgi:PilZ domain-containing protein